MFIIAVVALVACTNRNKLIGGACFLAIITLFHVYVCLCPVRIITLKKLLITNWCNVVEMCATVRPRSVYILTTFDHDI